MSTTQSISRAPLEFGLQRISDARHHDPFAVLGRHTVDGRDVVRAYLPATRTVSIVENEAHLERIAGTDFFEWSGERGSLPSRYQLRRIDEHGNEHTNYDPYCFAPQIGEFDLHLYAEGKHWHAYRFLGANPLVVDGVAGVLFAVWAPNAERVSVIGDFNAWDGRRHPMRVRGSSGVWELFMPGLGAGTLYKFELRNRPSGEILVKADPYARSAELRPRTASRVAAHSRYEWGDGQWLEQRSHGAWLHQPFAIYEVHLGSWRRDAQGRFLSYRDAADQLVAYVADMGFTHIELLPVTEHPLDASWGYQSIGYFAPTRRFGEPDDLRYFIDLCHRNDIGVILDWVPAHFPRDMHGLARFDGTPLYEHADPRRGEHLDWGTLIFNYGRNEVCNFLLCSALYWLEEFHIDGLRVDAVASMLYLDYSRPHDQWVPNEHGGRENLDAIKFLRALNEVVHDQHAGAVVMAEESTDWPMVSRPTWLGGLGFSMKWNMGWMHDTLEYMSQDPVYRQYHHNLLTFSLLYAFTENFVLPFSHDEVVHGKRSLIDKMPGDPWQRFANLRLLLTYMYTHPGKKLLFMGCEFAHGTEWNFDTALDWGLLDRPQHRGVQALVRDLNRLVRAETPLHRFDFEPRGFDWIDCHDASQSVVSFLRHSEDETVVVALNFTPVPRENYRIGVPHAGRYREILNSDSGYYGGSNLGNAGEILSSDQAWMGRPHSVAVTLPPLAGVVFKPDRANR